MSLKRKLREILSPRVKEKPPEPPPNLVVVQVGRQVRRSMMRRMLEAEQKKERDLARLQKRHDRREAKIQKGL